MSERPEYKHRYKITYVLKDRGEGLTKDELMEEREAAEGELGACDQVILHSIILPPDGGLSTLIVSKDGATGEPLSPEDIWKHWTLMAHHLIQTLPPGGRRMMCEMVMDMVRHSMGVEKDPKDAS